MPSSEEALRARCAEFGQSHLFRFWEQLDAAQRAALLADIAQIDFPSMRHLTESWILNKPEAEHFTRIDPVPVVPIVDPERPDARLALAAGEKALREGRVGLFLVAGGQGTRLGFDGPKGAYPIGPVSKRSLFAFHAEKIQNLRRRYGCTLPWYIMVSEANGAETAAFFEEHHYFGLGKENVQFLTQRMVPCVADDGRFLLEEPHRLAMNPNGHGGCLTAMKEKGVLADCAARGIDVLCYFQVDNWAVKVADPYFIGYHVLRGAKMSSKINRKHQPREAVGVHCLCDGEYRVIEYSELDLYPQLLETDAQGGVLHYAGNPAIHLISTAFVEEVCRRFDEFPWHLAHKKVPYLDDTGNLVQPAKPNAYKFETFVFDALRYCSDATVALEIVPPGEYTPIKSFSGDNSVEAAWRVMAKYWAGWLEAAGMQIPRDTNGDPTVPIEISPQFALDKAEFLRKFAVLPLLETLTEGNLALTGSLDRSTLVEAIRFGIEVAAREHLPETKHIKVEVDETTLEYHVFEIRIVVEKLKDAEAEIGLADAKRLNPDASIGDRLKIHMEPVDFGRAAAQAAKRVFMKMYENTKHVGLNHQECKGIAIDPNGSFLSIPP